MVSLINSNSTLKFKEETQLELSWFDLSMYREILKEATPEVMKIFSTLLKRSDFYFSYSLPHKQALEGFLWIIKNGIEEGILFISKIGSKEELILITPIHPIFEMCVYPLKEENLSQPVIFQYNGKQIRREISEFLSQKKGNETIRSISTRLSVPLQKQLPIDPENLQNFRHYVSANVEQNPTLQSLFEYSFYCENGQKIEQSKVPSASCVGCGDYLTKKALFFYKDFQFAAYYENELCELKTLKFRVKDLMINELQTSEMKKGEIKDSIESLPERIKQLFEITTPTFKENIPLEDPKIAKKNLETGVKSEEQDVSSVFQPLLNGPVNLCKKYLEDAAMAVFVSEEALNKIREMSRNNSKFQIRVNLLYSKAIVTQAVIPLSANNNGLKNTLWQLKDRTVQDLTTDMIIDKQIIDPVELEITENGQSSLFPFRLTDKAVDQTEDFRFSIHFELSQDTDFGLKKESWILQYSK